MRSNCVGHLGNDTFIAATRDETDNVFLVTGAVVEERVTPYPLARRVLFFPQSELVFAMAGEAEENRAVTAVVTDTCDRGDLKNMRHSFHTSFDGRFVAAIGNGHLMHYLINVQSARVCEFRTRECVVSVTWHPTSTTHLILLQATGTLLVIRGDSERLSVLFEDTREVHLTDIIADVKDYIFTGNDPTLTAELEDYRGRKHNLAPEVALKGIESESPQKKITQREATKISSSSSSLTTAVAGGPDIVHSPSTRLSAVVPPAEATSSALLRTPLMGDGFSAVALSVIPATRSLPVMLLWLTRSGDVFSMKLGADGLPASLKNEYDGRVKTILGEQPEKHRDTGPSPCVHYLWRGGTPCAGYEEQPLAIGSAMVDEDVGRHVVFVLYSSGVLRGCWFTEPDLLCRDLMRQHMDFSIALGAALPPEYLLPTRAMPCMTHLVGVQTCGNSTLIRYDDAAYLCVWPLWSRKAAGWVYREVGTDGCQRLPVVGRSAVIPEPITLRLPYDVTDAGVCVGVNDILIFPEVAIQSEPCRRSRPILVKISTVVLAAVYARGGKYSLTFGELDDPVSTVGDNNSAGKEKTESRAHHQRLEDLLEMTAESFGRWICGYPHDAIGGKTAELAQDVKDVHAVMQKHHIDLQRREGQLAVRVRQLMEKQQQMTEAVEHSQHVIREALMHRRGVDSLYAANTMFGKIHKLLNELETLVELRKTRKLDGNELIICEGEKSAEPQEMRETA